MSKTQKSLNRNYIVIESWMVSELGLKGNSLLIYALIYGFSQTEKQLCSCGIEYMRAWTNSSKQGVLNALEQLIAAELIERVEETEGDGRRTAYRAIGQESRPNLSEKISQQSVPKSMKKVKKVDLKIGQQSCENRSTKFRAYKDNINNYNTDLSVSHSAPARESDGLTEEENALRCYGQTVVDFAKEKGIDYETAYFLDCAKFRFEMAGIEIANPYAQRLLDIMEAVGREKKVSIKGALVPTKEVLQTLLQLTIDERTLTKAVMKSYGSGDEVKNKLGYAISTLYNHAKEF